MDYIDRALQEAYANLLLLHRSGYAVLANECGKRLC